MRHLKVIGSAILLSGAFAGAAHAETITLDSFSELTGWINSDGGQFLPTPDHNMFTGNEFGQRFNSYALFFIPEGAWTSATLTTTPAPFGAVGPSQIDIYDVSTPLDALLNDISPGEAAFADLGSGDLYGSAIMFDSTVGVALSQAFLDDANALGGGYILLGFTNATLNAVPSGDEQDDGIYINGVGRGLLPIQITLSTGVTAAVPEPASWAMMIGGFALAGAGLRRQRVSLKLALA